MANSKKLFERRRKRVRHRIAVESTGRPRLTVYRSGKHIYAQLIDDANSQTIASASSHEKAEEGAEKAKAKTWNVAAAADVGKRIASRAKEKGVKAVVFDRGGYLYHGRVKALADAARAGGLEF
jgi:large subunit ribosomal protein L18